MDGSEYLVVSVANLTTNASIDATQATLSADNMSYTLTNASLNAGIFNVSMTDFMMFDLILLATAKEMSNNDVATEQLTVQVDICGEHRNARTSRILRSYKLLK